MRDEPGGGARPIPSQITGVLRHLSSRSLAIVALTLAITVVISACETGPEPGESGLPPEAAGSVPATTSSERAATGSEPSAVGEADATPPSTETVRSLIMSNWSDSVAIHYARQLYRQDSQLFGPYLSALHDAADWPTNQIDGATAFLRGEVEGPDATAGGATVPAQSSGPDPPPSICESGNGEVPGDDAPVDPDVPGSYPSVMCFDGGGAMHVEYLRESELGLPVQIQKSYAMTPDQPFVVVRYTLTSGLTASSGAGALDVRARLTEVIDLNNKAAPDHEESGDDLAGTGINEPQGDQRVEDMQAEWQPDLQSWIADMSASNGTFVVFGSFQEMDEHRAFETAGDHLDFNRAVQPETESDTSGPRGDVDRLTAKDLGMAMSAEVVLGPTDSQEYAFFYAVTSSLEEAQDAARQAREPEEAQFWFDETAAAYEEWLQEGREVAVPDAGMQKAYVRALITAKQAQQPDFGTWVAATNPAYGFKVWARDSSVTALGLAAAGHLEEAVKYYRWMASVQEDGSVEKLPQGSWYTNYSYWLAKRPVPFVEPEHDATGLFMVGVYHTWRLLNEEDPDTAREFLTGRIEGSDEGPRSVYEAVTRSAEFVANSIDEYGFGPPDLSIWEEELEWATFTQVAYAAGLNAASLLAEELGETDLAGKWVEGASRIREAIDRPSTAEPCPGLWNEEEGRWNRGTRPDCTVDDRVDASTDLVWVFGLVDSDDERAASQREAVLATLTPGEDDIGIARSEGDTFYFQSPFSPGGKMEATAEMSSWPQMDMYMAMLEHWTGQDDIALERLTWYARVTNVGYMPPGEGVDWPTDRPLPSTATEPVTGAWYVLGLTNYLDLFDPRLPPLESEPAPRPSRIQQQGH